MFSQSNTVFLGILAFTVLSTANQQTFASVPGNYESYNSGLFSPRERLSTLSETAFAHLGHPAFPDYNVRIKRSKFCDETVNAYTGYIDIQARHLFFYFFESRNDPDKDDVVFWTNGGPGCSSSTGLFMEHGPCKVVDSNNTKVHPESWNSNANVFYIDQPIGTGFSYADYGESVSTAEEAAKDIASFMAIFFEHFVSFKGRALHLAGESYAGRMLPLFAAEIFDQNKRLIELGGTPVNLKSIMIGNGLTNAYTMTESYWDMVCTSASIEPILDIGTCVAMKQKIPRCKKWLKENCVDQFDRINCGASISFCNDALLSPFMSARRNPYDISRNCTIEEYSDSICYPISKDIKAYLDRPHIRSLLGVDASLTSNFTSCAYDIVYAFQENLDEYRPTYHYVSALLERGIKVLVYVGTYDWICNHVGNQKWTEELEWSGHDEFSNMPLREWIVDGKRAGVTRSAKGLTYLTIDGGGHMAPYDKPREALDMVNRWLAGQDF